MSFSQAYKVPKPRNPSQAYFPHILIKNTVVSVDFAGKSSSSGPVPVNDRFNGYPPWQVGGNASLHGVWRL